MLKEIMPIRRASHDVQKRWFSSRDMDLFIWLKHNMPVKFLLSYNKRQTEYAIQWEQNNGFQHFLVDTGENPSEEQAACYKQAPLLLALINKFDAYHVARDFLQNSENIDNSTADFIYARLFEYPDFITAKTDKHLKRLG